MKAYCRVIPELYAQYKRLPSWVKSGQIMLRLMNYNPDEYRQITVIEHPAEKMLHSTVLEQQKLAKMLQDWIIQLGKII